MMACPALETGHDFVATTLAHIDCQAQTIGAYGFGALAGSGSPAAPLLLALLTLFIALFGLRLMFGQSPDGRDLVLQMLKVGIVLTLATSWPAWRTLAYDVALGGPGEVADAVALGSGLPGGRGDLVSRLQSADNGIVTLTMYGTGRLTGGVSAGSDLGDATTGVALADQWGLAWGRVAYLVGTLGPLALVRLTAGMLLALAPLMAGLLLFWGTRDIFWGWLRMLGATALSAAALALVCGVELALIEPWLANALAQRAANQLIPAAPTELLVMTMAFCLVGFGVVALIVKLMFLANTGLTLSLPASETLRRISHGEAPLPLQFAGGGALHQSRAQQVADAVAETLRREERVATKLAANDRVRGGPGASSALGAQPLGAVDRLGDSFRRNQRRVSRASATRDQRA